MAKCVQRAIFEGALEMVCCMMLTLSSQTFWQQVVIQKRYVTVKHSLVKKVCHNS